MPPWRFASRYRSTAPSHGTIAARCGGRSAATRHALMAKYDTPITATRPLLQPCVPAHSTQSWKSSASPRDSSRGTAGRLAGAARVAAHDGVALWHPPLRVHRLPVHVLVLLGETTPRRGIPLAEMHVLRIGPERDDHREGALFRGTEHVREDGAAVANRDRDVLLDAQSMKHHAADSPDPGFEKRGRPQLRHRSRIRRTPRDRPPPRPFRARCAPRGADPIARSGRASTPMRLRRASPRAARWFD